MKNLRFPVIFALILTLPAVIGAQNRGAPHVTGIQVETRDNLKRITWIDSPDARGHVYIFRSARPFVGSIPANIRPVIVRYGQQYYIDDIDDMGNVHYFIAASDSLGRRFDLIIPHINSTSVDITQTEEPVTAAESAVRELARGISNLRAVQDGERIIIFYDTSGPRKNAILYRSMQSVRQPQDLLNAVIVQSGVASPFVDYPLPGISFYYAVIYEDEISSGNVGIRPGDNATVTPVVITSQQRAERSIRPIPLPILTIRNAMPEGFYSPIPDTVPLSSETANALRNNRMPSKMPIVLKSPRVFAVDLEAPTGGEESALFQIVMENFINLDWENARVRIQHYLSLPRSVEIEARARFYLGQTLYYTEKYKEALMEFLSFKAHHPAEANNWIEAVLTAMVY
ncbi:MAG: hypothetical protein FWB73_04765 [Treponema sp.]|nr:hypothetical protein [Treponema sp.]